MCWWEEGIKGAVGGLGKGPKSGTIDSEHGAGKGRNSQLHTRSFQSKRVVYTFKYLQNATNAIKKPHGGETEHALILGSMDCTVVNKSDKKFSLISD